MEKMEDWARRIIAEELGIQTKGLTKNDQWGRIVCNLANTMKHYHRLVKLANSF